MRRGSGQEVQKNRLWAILPWLLIFALCIALVLGYVRRYELRLTCEEREGELSELQTELGALKKERERYLTEQAIAARAQELGLYLPDPEEIIVIHVPAADG